MDILLVKAYERLDEMHMKPQKTKYQIEIDNFHKNFRQYKDKKIALYGIGRRTATLLPEIRDFQVIGLLDRDSGNRDMVISGVPVISLEEAEEQADLLIINSDPTNFLTIYRRIVQTCLPVYYANGEKAELPQEDVKENEYWMHTRQELEEKIKKHDIISFDFFDTLVMRKILTPSDLFLLLDKRAKEKFGIDFDLSKARQEAAAQADGVYDLNLNEIYQKLRVRENLDNQLAHALMQLELELEQEVCVPRSPVIELLRMAQNFGKDVYIISDTYFLLEQIQLFMEICKIDTIQENHLYLSSRLGCCKQDGGMWKYFREKHLGKSILHIGDHMQADIELPKKYGIDTFYLMSGRCMLENSSIAALLPKAVSLSHSVHLGLLITRLFADPFVLNASRGKVTFSKVEDFGYAVFGGVMTRFLMWLYGQAVVRRYDRLLFFARDGYFLERDFQALQNFVTKPINTEYIPISRRLIYLATMETEADFHRVMTFPYIGTFADYLKSRFNIKCLTSKTENPKEFINAASDGEKLLNLLKPYQDKIRQEAEYEQKNYLRYLKKMNINRDDMKEAVVDYSYYGTNQYYFQKLLQKRYDGYYFFACHATDNAYRNSCALYSCFNEPDDPEAENSLVKKKSAYLESFLTAPYGMIRHIDESGKWICEPAKTNQRNFAAKEKVNNGIQCYMQNYLSIYGVSDANGVDDTMEALSYYLFLNQSNFVTDEIKSGFYFDNDMIGSKEMPLEL